MQKNELAKMIDHTMLKPDATKASIEKLCKEALDYNFASVCVNPSRVAECYSMLKDSEVKVCTVIGFPLGATTTAVKVFETEDAIKNGATEVDMVINIGKLKDKDYDFVKKDIQAVVDAAKGKASGGVRSIEDAEIMIKNGASRIGASASIEICEGKVSTSDY